MDTLNQNIPDPIDQKDTPILGTSKQGVDSYQIQSITLFAGNANTAANYSRFFLTPYPMEIAEAWATWENAASGGGSPKVGLVRMTKNQDALSAGQNLLSAQFDVTGSVNQVHRIRSQGVISARFINNGDTLGLSATGTLTGLSSFNMTVVMRPLTTVLGRSDTP